MEEIVRKPKQPVQGFVTVELFDNGYKIKTVKSKNMITQFAKEHMIWDMKEDFFRGCPGTLPTEPQYALSHIALYTAAAPENDPAQIPDLGTLIGWCNKTAYAGADTKRGTINRSESYANEEKAHWVFDWPTNSGNGTFQTIVWCSFDETLVNHKLVVKTYFASPDIYPRGLAWDGTNLWLSVGDAKKIYRLNPTTGEVISSFGSPDAIPRGLAWDGTNLWLAGDYADKIYKLNPTTGEVISSFASPDIYPYSLAWDGTNLWLAGLSAKKIYKLNPTTGEVISSFGSPDIYTYGLAWDGTNLWLSGDYADKIYKLNPTTGEVISSFASPDTTPTGLVWDGTNLWLAGVNTKKIYKLQAAIGAHTLLPQPVTKTNQQTMKIQYDFLFEE